MGHDSPARKAHKQLEQAWKAAHLPGKPPGGFGAAVHGLFGLDTIDSYTPVDDNQTVVGLLGRSLVVAESYQEEGQHRCRIEVHPLADCRISTEYRDPWLVGGRISDFLAQVTIEVADQTYTVTVKDTPPVEGRYPRLEWIRTLIAAKSTS